MKSRVPFEDKCYLLNWNTLKLSLYIISWLGMTSTGIYFGYTFTFYLNMGATGCTSDELKDYARGYWINVIMSGVMTLMAIVSFFVAIGVRKEPRHMKDELFKAEEESKMNLSPLKVDVQEQRRVATQELPNIPKINRPLEIEMVDQQPIGFEANYVSNENMDRVQQAPFDPNNYHPQITYNPYTSNSRAPSQFVLPSFRQEPYQPLIPASSSPYQPSPVKVGHVHFDLKDQYAPQPPN